MPTDRPQRYGGKARYTPTNPDHRKPCAIAGCDRLTQAASGMCFEHRSDISVSRSQDSISIAGVSFTVDAALKIADRIADMADEIERNPYAR